MARIGATPRIWPQPADGLTQPAPITNAAPSVGSRAAVPGYVVAELNWVQDSAISPSPVQPVIAAARGDRRCHRAAVRATSPPRVNCHARVGREKNATGATQ